MGSSVERSFRKGLRNVLAVAIGWLSSLALVQLGERALAGWPAAEIGQTVGFAVGVTVALALNARPMAYLWAAMAAFSASELLVHSRYGIGSAQGAPTHFAVMGAAALAVALGAWIRHTGGETVVP
jgi:hypothetical protein